MESPTVLVVHNEVDAAYEYHSNELASHFPGCLECNFPAGERPDLEGIDAVVISGSTAGVYEVEDEPWIADQQELIRELVERRIPTLGVCFGHQVANAALGGRVEHVGPTHRLVAVDFDGDPLFDGVAPVVPAIHGDSVLEPGEGMETIARTEHSPHFGTRHRDAPLWTVQFHPELSSDYHNRIERDFGWTETDHSYDDVTAARVFENFTSLVRGSTDA
ncbi:type 1 glutamine amidotransferase [Natrononativus amylolyticus]|uniref:type 1 glutamine amidotransferase n=1 Tax=Natrononativus amylolyticus TaxID=2963434 RepID=UPI0020CD8338|nr:type 1 glutamine amidotransferase [Natrononativus amylolyticus]